LGGKWAILDVKLAPPIQNSAYYPVVNAEHRQSRDHSTQIV